MNPHQYYRPGASVETELLSHAMKREWHKVVDTYLQNPEAHTATITMSGDTALHMAISDGQTAVVKFLVKSVKREALRIRNKQGNTPLHVAAYLGNTKMCKWIAERDWELVGVVNERGQTPIFLAVVHGRKEAFVCMYRIIKGWRSDKGMGYCGDHDGRNILHSAIYGEHFDLAIQIIQLYPKANRRDMHGIGPLHILATKPSAFKSGTRVGILHQILYHCIYIRELQIFRDEDDENKTWTFFGFIRRLFYCWTPATEKDSENPNLDHPPTAVTTATATATDDERESSSCLNPDYFYCGELGYYLSRILEKIPTIITLGVNRQIRRIVDEKRKHKWASQLMIKLVGGLSPAEFQMETPNIQLGRVSFDQHNEPNKSDNNGSNKNNSEKEEEARIMVEKVKGKFGISIRGVGDEKKDYSDDDHYMRNEKKETPMLIAAKHGIMEMVEYILWKYPLAIHNQNVDGKNIVLLAVECRQPHVYKFLLRQKVMTEAIFYKTDNDDNSALHLAAMLANRRNWLIPGPALQMQWEVKWYQYVEKSKPAKFFIPCNKKGETPWQIFTEHHKDLVKEARDWLYKTSESCSVVAVLIATVAFTASATVPGGVESNGSPVLRKQPAFNVFAIASLVALCFSIASVVMFMAFFTSRHREKDYGTNLPAKLLVELTSLLISIAAVLVSFCAAHFFVIKDTFKYTAFSLYAATLFPVALYAFWQIPMYYELVKATWRSTPQRVYEHE